VRAFPVVVAVDEMWHLLLVVLEIARAFPVDDSVGELRHLPLVLLETAPKSLIGASSALLQLLLFEFYQEFLDFDAPSIFPFFLWLNDAFVLLDLRFHPWFSI
jgi:hypothetical protein